MAPSTSNSVSLRRSCKACVKSKRRCDLLFPTCSRCATRGTVCEYINVPFSSSTGQVKEHGQGVMSHVHPSLQVEILKTHDQAIVRFLIDCMRGFPVAFAQFKMTLFIHPDIHGSSLENIRNVCTFYQRPVPFCSARFDAFLRQTFVDICRRAKHPTSFENLLTCVQSLVLIQCMLIFDRDDANAESTNKVLATLARRLWAQAPAELPHCLSPRRAWLFGESVRRTIIVSFILCSVYSLQKQHYSVRTPFVEALPFDNRTSLWDAPSDEGWQEGTSRRLVSMVSLREYSDMLASGATNEVTEFGCLVLAACKGILPLPPAHDRGGS